MKKKTNSAKKRSLTEQFTNSSDIMKAPSLSKVADSEFDRDKVLSKIFPRTIEDVRAVDADTGKIRTTKSEVFDSCIHPNETDMFDMYNTSLKPSCCNLQNKILNHYYENYAWLGWLTCATLAQHPLISRACSIPGEDAVAVGYKLSLIESEGPTDVNSLRIKKLINESKKMGINQTLRKFDSNKRVFGIGICIPCFEAMTEEANKYIDKIMELPFNIDAFRKRRDIKYIGMKVVDPYWLTPQFDSKSAFDPSSRDFYMPTWWMVGETQRKIHRSWTVSIVNTIVADILKPTYYYGGIPLPQMLMSRMYSADKVADEAQLLAMSKRLLVVDANVQKLVANPKEATKTMNALKYARDNWGVFFKNPNTNVQQVDTYITEFNQLIMTQYQLVASIAQIPAPKLLKVMPTGFSDVSELVWKDYAQQITSIQEDEFVPILDMHYMLHLAINHGKLEEFEITFNPVDVPTLMEKAKISELEARVIKTLVEEGVVAPHEVRQVLRSKKGGEYSQIEKIEPTEAKRKMDFVIEQAKIAATTAEKTAKMTSKPTDRAIKNKIT